MFVDQFRSLIIALLAVAALIAFWTDEPLQGSAILVVLLLNAFAGLITEWRAGRALEMLRRRVHITARLRRDGVECMTRAEELVPGDIIVIDAGDQVPADARILTASQISVEESALTGESSSVEKTALAVPVTALVTERSSMVFLGTHVVAGRATAVVTCTGANTELGKIGRLVAITPNEYTPLKRSLDQLGRRLVYIVLAVGAMTTLVGWLRGTEFFLMAEVGISLAIAAVPEALPAVTTLILALGVLHMARHRAIIRRLAAVETLGRTTVICTDKTGTLTENRMAVREYRLADGTTVNIESGGRPRHTGSVLGRALRAGVLCSDASCNPARHDEARFVGDPTETALLRVADQFGLNAPELRSQNAKLNERPFDGAVRMMATTHRTSSGAVLSLLKGSPGVVLAACSGYAADSKTSKPLDQEIGLRFEEANDEMAGRAMRVLGLAERFESPTDAVSAEASIDSRCESHGYTFLGFVGMIDPPRPEVGEALDRARSAGIRVIMLTGDQPNTARAIAKELRIGGKEPMVVHAREIEELAQDELAELASRADAFARVSPEDKLRIVEALQTAGEVVAVTGDGMNDAPALKRADIGIAMGLRGSEVAKEAADVVLADDNFATIVLAVQGGRAVYANVTRFVHLMLSKNLGAILAIFGAITLGWALPLLPLQILWINLVTDFFPAMALAVEPPAAEAMRRHPKRNNGTLLSRAFIQLIVWQGVMLGALVLVSYWWALQRYGAGSHARTIVMLTLIGGQLGHMFNCRSRRRSALSGLFRSPFVWGAAAIVMLLQGAAVYVAPLAKVLETSHPTLGDWPLILAFSIAPLVIVESTKLVSRRLSRAELSLA